MLFELSETTCVGSEIISLEGDVTINANKRSRPASAEMSLSLLLFESGVAMRADKGNHRVENIGLLASTVKLVHIIY
jgi:hypothetical protein